MSHKPKVAKLDGLAKLPHLTVLKTTASNKRDYLKTRFFDLQMLIT